MRLSIQLVLIQLSNVKKSMFFVFACNFATVECRWSESGSRETDIPPLKFNHKRFNRPLNVAKCKTVEFLFKPQFPNWIYINEYWLFYSLRAIIISNLNLLYNLRWRRDTPWILSESCPCTPILLIHSS